MLIQIVEVPEQNKRAYDFSQQDKRTWYVLKSAFQPDKDPEFIEQKDDKITVPLYPAISDAQNRDAQVIGCTLAIGAAMALGLENEPVDAIRIFINGPVTNLRVGAAFRRKQPDGDKAPANKPDSTKG